MTQSSIHKLTYNISYTTCEVELETPFDVLWLKNGTFSLNPFFKIKKKKCKVKDYKRHDYEGTTIIKKN